MRIEKLCRIKDDRQDGVICNGFLFSFNYMGVCTVYDINSIVSYKDGDAEIFSEFVLDKSDVIAPHGNSVAFGSGYFEEGDEFPLLYTNIYNNYHYLENKLKGVSLVYRLQRFGNRFETTLVQMIEVGFTEDEKLWKSEGATEDVRPYGNLAIDAEKGIYYAFTMRDNPKSTRYFAFRLPEVSDGELCEKYNVKKVTLNESDILKMFDCDYHKYVQGACCRNGMIYSLEGFTDDKINPPAIRIIDTDSGKQVCFREFGEMGSDIEPEMIDFEGDICYYSDHNGNLYKMFF